MAEWHEFDLWYTIFPNQSDIFAFKKTHLLPMLERYGVEDFLMLDEPNFVVLRIDIDSESAKRIFSDLEQTIKMKPVFSRVTMQSWSPITDAIDRIHGGRSRLLAEWERVKKIPGIVEGLAGIPEEGWMIKGKTPNGKWEVAPEDLDKEVEALSVFMSKVLGKFTKAYLKEMPYRVQDRWLMSVFLHLALDSVSTWLEEEDEIREFPAA